MQIAIIGAGPGGIVAAKFLVDEGLPVIVEQSDMRNVGNRLQE